MSNTVMPESGFPKEYADRIKTIQNAVEFALGGNADATHNMCAGIVKNLLGMMIPVADFNAAYRWEAGLYVAKTFMEESRRKLEEAGIANTAEKSRHMESVFVAARSVSLVIRHNVNVMDKKLEGNPLQRQFRNLAEHYVPDTEKDWQAVQNLSLAKNPDMPATAAAPGLKTQHIKP